MTCNLLTEKDPIEKIVVTFDFSLALEGAELLSSIASVTVSVSAGTDASPNLILIGVPILNVDNLSIQQPIGGGLDGVNYNIKVIANTTNPNKRLALTAILPVRSQ